MADKPVLTTTAGNPLTDSQNSLTAGRRTRFSTTPARWARPMPSATRAAYCSVTPPSC